MNEEILTEVGERLELPASALKKMIEGFDKIILNHARQLEEIYIPGFGIFAGEIREEREVVHPASGKDMLIPPRVILVLKKNDAHNHLERSIKIKELSGELAKITKTDREKCEVFIISLFESIKERLLLGEPAEIKGFGSFRINEDFSDNKEITPAEKKISDLHINFFPDKEFARKLNAPFEHFEAVIFDSERTPIGTIENEKEELSEDLHEGKEENLTTRNLEIQSDEEGEDDEATAEAYLYENLESQEKPSEKLSHRVEEIDRDSQAHEEVVLHPEIHGEERKRISGKFSLGFLSGCGITLFICVTIFLIGLFNGWFDGRFVRDSAILSTETKENNGDGAHANGNPVNITVEEIDATPEPEQPIVYDTVSPTRVLTKIARVHYGNMHLWPYIYEENKAILGHPNRIKPGTRIVVPPLSKYGVNPENKEDIEKAKKMGAEIYSRYR